MKTLERTPITLSIPARALVATAALVIVLGPLLGCQSRIRVALEMPPDNEATVQVTGDEPAVTIENTGPGEIAIAIGAAGGPIGKADTRIGKGKIKQSHKGPVKIRLESFDGETRVVIHATGATGIHLDDMPKPKP